MRSYKVFPDDRINSGGTGIRAGHRDVARRNNIEIRESLGKDWFLCPTCGQQYRLPSKAVGCKKSH
jgi:hypothetical protein